MSTIVGMFDDPKAAQRAIDGLDALGLEEGSIHVLTRAELEKGGSLIGDIARSFRAGRGEVSSELIRLGLDREEAEFYEEELDEESLLVVVRADGENGDRAMAVMQEANAALREN